MLWSGLVFQNSLAVTQAEPLKNPANNNSVCTKNDPATTERITRNYTR